MQDLFGNETSRPTRKTANGWRPVASAPKGDRLDLFVGIFNEVGQVVHDCWWNAKAKIPDWYRDGDGGKPQLAAKIFYLVTHWKPAGTPDGPDKEDGGPPIRSRTWINATLEETWPHQMRDRLVRYLEAIERGEIDHHLIDDSPAPTEPPDRSASRPELVVVTDDEIPW